MSNVASSSESFEFEALQVAVNYRKAIYQEMRPYLGQEVLEVGAGIGQFSRVLLERNPELKLTALEPQDEFVQQLAALEGRCRVMHGDTSTLPDEYEADTVINVNVLEHIEDHVGELHRYKKILNKQVGRLCLFVPARMELYAPIDTDFGHFRRYSKDSLTAVLTEAGFTVERMHYFNFPGYFLWWLNFKVLRQRKFNVSNVKAFDRYCFPLIHGFEKNIIRPLVGQSILAIARCCN